MALLSGIGEIPTIITTENYFNVVEENNVLFHALKGDLKKAHNYFAAETDNFTRTENLYKSDTIQQAWEKHLKLVNNIASKLDVNSRTAYTPYYSEGKNYKQARDLTISEIAKLVKQELEAIYSDWKFRVTTDSFSGGRSLKVEIVDVPMNPFSDDFIAEMQNNDFVWYEFGKNSHERKSYYNPEFEREIKKIEEIANQYNFNDSDAMTDYFSTSYYDHVGVNDVVLMYRYFPNNLSLKKNIAEREEYEQKRIAYNKKVAERKGKFGKGQPVMYEYTGKLFPAKKYEAKVLKSPNGRSRFSSYSISVVIDKRIDKDGNIVPLEKEQRYTFDNVSEEKLSAMEEENPLLKQKFKVGEKVYFTLDKPVFDTYKSKTIPILVPGVYEVEISSKTKGDYPSYSFKIPYTYFNEYHKKEFSDTRWFTQSPLSLRPLNSAISTKHQTNNFSFAKAKALALEIELKLLID